MACICREAGGRVRTNLMVGDMDVPAPVAVDNRRLEVVVDGLPVRGGAQVAVDTTLVCALHRDGVPRRGAAESDCVALQLARRKKESAGAPGGCGDRGRRPVVRGNTAAPQCAGDCASPP